MKGWIKLSNWHEPSYPIYIEAESVYSVENTNDNGWGESTLVNGVYYVRESVDEVMELLEEAKTNSLYRELKKAKATCQDIKTLHEGCDEDCPYWHGKNAWLCDALNHATPEYWELEKIPEEYR